jgi:hypothetical protein
MTVLLQLIIRFNQAEKRLTKTDKPIEIVQFEKQNGGKSEEK